MISAYKLLMSLNDPGWGRDKNNGEKRPNQGPPGPPDLDDLWRDFNRRLRALWGGKSGDYRGGQKGAPDPKRLNGTIILVLMVLFMFWLASGIYIVQAAQRGIVFQFGRYDKTTLPGLHWRIPYPVQTVEIVNLTNVRSVEIGYRSNNNNKIAKEALMLTEDENIIDIQFAVQYYLDNAEEFVLYNSDFGANRDPDETVKQAAESAIREVVGKSRMDQLLYEERAQIVVTTQELLQKILNRYNTGIYISKVTMQNAQPPEPVQAAFNDAIKAGQDKERQINEGDAYARDVVPRAEGTKSRLLEEANGYNKSVIAAAEGEASRFSQLAAEYVKAPEVTRRRLYLETLQQVYANTGKVMIDSRSAGNMLYLPLDKLMQGAGGIAASETRSSTGRSYLPSFQLNTDSALQSGQAAADNRPLGMSGSGGDILSRSREEALRAARESGR